jgi:ornithine cyclodeaminase
MPALVLSPLEVRRLLPMETCMDLMADALKCLSRGDATNPLRRGMLLPEKKGILGMMPGYLGSPKALGLKVVAVFPGNHGTKYDAHQGVVMLFDPEIGVPLAIVDASEITAIRTAAATGVATGVLARSDAGTLAILGSGVQARTHLEAMLIVRSIERVRVYSPSEANRQAFAERESARYGIKIEPAGSAREAVTDADIICTTTSAQSSNPASLSTDANLQSTKQGIFFSPRTRERSVKTISSERSATFRSAR